MFNLKLTARAALAAALLGASVAASAALVTSRGALGGDDFIDWGQLGADNVQVTPQPAAVTSNGARAATVGNLGPGGELWRFDQAGASSGFGGNFADGDELLSTFFSSGPIRIDFADGIGRVGAQIMSFAFGAFDGVITVFDAGNNQLESYTVSGLSSADADNSAIFIGITRAAADIRRVEFNILTSDPLDSLSINQVDFGLRGTGNGGGGGGQTPTPATLALVSLGLLGLWRSRRNPR